MWACSPHCLSHRTHHLGLRLVPAFGYWLQVESFDTPASKEGFLNEYQQGRMLASDHSDQQQVTMFTNNIRHVAVHCHAWNVKWHH